MRALLFSALLLSLVSYLSADIGQCGQPANRVTARPGSRPADAHEFPWLAYVTTSFIRLSVNCTGALINKEWILTSAHCVTFRGQPANRVSVGLGVNVVDDLAVDRLQVATSVIVHPSYQANDSLYDFALVKLPTPVSRFDEQKNRICLPDESITMCNTTGALRNGAVDDCSTLLTAKFDNNIINKVTLEPTGLRRCFGSVSPEIRKVKACMKPDSVSNPCSLGNGGGVLMCRKRRRLYFVGIGSEGHSDSTCEGRQRVSAYSRLCEVLPWIKRSTQPTRQQDVCDKPTFANPNSVELSQSSFPVASGKDLQVTCLNGLEFPSEKTTQQIVCDRGEWHPRNVICGNWVHCHEIPAVDNGYIACDVGEDDYSYDAENSTCYVECEGPLSVKGAATITCQSNGRWTRPGSCVDLSNYASKLDELLAVCESGDVATIADHLTRVPPDILASPGTWQGRRDDGATPLHMIARRKLIDALDLFGDLGMVTGLGKVKNLYKQAAIHEAAVIDADRIVKFMVEKDSSLLELREGQYERTPVYVACEYGSLDTVKVLIAKGANLRARSNGRYSLATPANEAAEYGHLEVVKALIRHDVTLGEERLGVTGELPIHNAAFRGHRAVVVFLLRRLPNQLRALDNNGNQPIHLAAENGHLEVVELLLEKGVSVDVEQRSLGRTPLHLASLNGHADLVTFLINKGANVMAKSSAEDNASMAIHLAVTNNQFEVVKLLVATDRRLLRRKNGLGQRAVDLAALISANTGEADIMHNWLLLQQSQS